MTGNNGKPDWVYRMQDYRCMTCGRLLFRAILTDGAKVHIKCPKCGRGKQIECEGSHIASMTEADVEVAQI